jgi:hypothetical protein
MAAGQGYPMAQHSLGILYAQGLGVPQDDVAALLWLDLAAALGNPFAAKDRDIVARRMTAERIAEAEKQARAWRPDK